MKLSESQPFGMLAAEDEDSWLESVYLADVLDQRHQAALASHHQIILGMRGVGKTALARFLKFQRDRPFAAYVSINQRTALSRIHADVQELLFRSRVPFPEDIVRLWLLAFWTALMSELQQKHQLYSEAVQKYLRVAQPKGPLGREQILLDGLAASLRNEGTTLLDWDRLVNLLDGCDYARAEEDTKQCLQHLGRVAIVIDSLEDLPVESNAMESVARALLAAVGRGRELHDAVQIKCMVPTELWRLLAPKIAGRSKLAPFEMRWTIDDLVRLACRRYTHYLSEKMGANAPVMPGAVAFAIAADVRSRVWGRFFPHRSSGTSGLPEDVEFLLMRHTQLKPRQLIQLCNGIASRSHLWRFNPDHVRAAIREQVNELSMGVFAAYSHIYPNAEALLQKPLHGVPAVFQSDSVNLEPQTWRVGYELGILGPVVSTSKKPFDSADFNGYRRASFNFCETGPAEWVPQDELVAVHPMFHRHFAIVETAETVVGFDGMMD